MAWVPAAATNADRLWQRIVMVALRDWQTMLRALCHCSKRECLSHWQMCDKIDICVT